MKRVLVLVVALSASLASVVSAHTSSFNDSVDAGYVLDIKSASLRHNSRKLIGEVTFWEDFPDYYLGLSGTFIVLDLDTDRDVSSDYSVVILRTRRLGLHGKLYRGIDFVRNLTAVSRGTAENGSPLFTVRVPRRAVRVSGSGFYIRFRWYSHDVPFGTGSVVDTAPGQGMRRLTI